jgi:hypothetical protein
MRVVAPEKIAEFIVQQNKFDELTDWHIVLVSNKKENRVHLAKINNLNVGSVLRTPISKVQPDKISIGVLSNPADHILDFSKKERDEIQEKYNKLPVKSGGTKKVVERATFFRQHRPVERGLLILYIAAKEDTVSKGIFTYGLEGNEVVGFCISFPASKNAKDIEYVVNPVYLDEE